MGMEFRAIVLVMLIFRISISANTLSSSDSPTVPVAHTSDQIRTYLLLDRGTFCEPCVSCRCNGRRKGWRYVRI